MKIFQFLVGLICIALVAGVGVAEAPVQLLRAGLFHGDEFKAEAGPDWWGVFPEGEGYALRRAPVTVTVAWDGIMDSEGEKTGRLVTILQDATPVVLVKGLESMEEGPLLHRDFRYTFVYPGQHHGLGLSDVESSRGFSITALGRVVLSTETPEPVIHDYELQLIQGNRPVIKNQLLVTAAQIHEEGRPRIVWAGDLDRDGKTDLLLDITSSFNVTHLALFLTSAAKDGEMMGKVAELRTTGC